MPSLFGSSAPGPKLTDLLTGDSRDFAASLGNWTASGLTLTRDATYQITGLTASAKLVGTSTAHYAQVAIPGSFAAATDYFAIIALSWEYSAADTESVEVLFGLQGTDTNGMTISLNHDTLDPRVGDGKFAYYGIRWRPTAARTGVTVRVRTAGLGGGSTTSVHVGMLRVLRGQTGAYFDAPPLLGVVNSDDHIIIPLMTSKVSMSPWDEVGTFFGGVSWRQDGGMEISDSARFAEIDVHRNYIYAYQEHQTTGDLLAGGNGYEWQVGPDYVGWYWTEYDASTIQFYADDAGGYFMQLRNRGSGKGWSVSDDGATNQKITDTFQWPFYVSGAQTTGTDKAAYFQVPEKCRIDEVRIHLGTAPTDASFIVDVNDDGTTIFTTQGNRPTVLTATNDATSGAPDGGVSVAKNSVLTIDVDQIGSTIAGSDLVVFVRGRYIW